MNLNISLKCIAGPGERFLNLLNIQSWTIFALSRRFLPQSQSWLQNVGLSSPFLVVRSSLLVLFIFIVLVDLGWILKRIREAIIFGAASIV